MTTSRRSFFKCLVGAFVASAIELNLAVEPMMPRVGQLDGLMLSPPHTTIIPWSEFEAHIRIMRQIFNHQPA